MSTLTLRSRDYPVLPWKNGLGASKVIASHPDGAGYDAAIWQISTTAIESSCPFSNLPGFDRLFMLLEGGGVELHCRTLDGAPDVRRRIERPFDPFAFRGDSQTECRLLGGPVQAFNLLTRRGRCNARLTVLTVAAPVEFAKGADEVLLIYVAAGDATIEDRSEALATHDAMLAEGSTPGRYAVSAGSARLVVAHIAPVRDGAGQ